MEGSLSGFGGPTWGADSTSPQSTERSRERSAQPPTGTDSAILDDRRLPANSIRGRIIKKKKIYEKRNRTVESNFAYKCIIYNINYILF